MAYPSQTKEMMRTWQRAYRKRHPERVQATQKRHYYKDVEKTRKAMREYARKWRALNPEKAKLHRAKSKLKHRDKYLRQYQDLRLTVLRHYSSGLLECNCCGINELKFLAIDHINNNGKEDRKKNGTSVQFYRYLIKNDFPEGYQILCHNCNMAKALYGNCPHNP